jgi:hypothetical protein
MAGGNLECDFTMLAKDREDFRNWLMKPDSWEGKKGTEEKEEREYFKIKPILVKRSENPGFLEGLMQSTVLFFNDPIEGRWWQVI